MFFQYQTSQSTHSKPKSPAKTETPQSKSVRALLLKWCTLSLAKSEKVTTLKLSFPEGEKPDCFRKQFANLTINLL